jgi:hypothetical protein
VKAAFPERVDVWVQARLHPLQVRVGGGSEAYVRARKGRGGPITDLVRLRVPEVVRQIDGSCSPNRMVHIPSVEDSIGVVDTAEGGNPRGGAAAS